MIAYLAVRLLCSGASLIAREALRKDSLQNMGWAEDYRLNVVNSHISRLENVLSYGALGWVAGLGVPGVGRGRQSFLCEPASKLAEGELRRAAGEET